MSLRNLYPIAEISRFIRQLCVSRKSRLQGKRGVTRISGKA